MAQDFKRARSVRFKSAPEMLALSSQGSTSNTERRSEPKSKGSSARISPDKLQPDVDIVSGFAFLSFASCDGLEAHIQLNEVNTRSLSVNVGQKHKILSPGQSKRADYNDNIPSKKSKAPTKKRIVKNTSILKAKKAVAARKLANAGQDVSVSGSTFTIGGLSLNETEKGSSISIESALMDIIPSHLNAVGEKSSEISLECPEILNVDEIEDEPINEISSLVDFVDENIEKSLLKDPLWQDEEEKGKRKKKKKKRKRDKSLQDQTCQTMFRLKKKKKFRVADNVEMPNTVSFPFTGSSGVSKSVSHATNSRSDLQRNKKIEIDPQALSPNSPGNVLFRNNTTRNTANVESNEKIFSKRVEKIDYCARTGGLPLLRRHQRRKEIENKSRSQNAGHNLGMDSSKSVSSKVVKCTTFTASVGTTASDESRISHTGTIENMAQFTSQAPVAEAGTPSFVAASTDVTQSTTIATVNIKSASVLPPTAVTQSTKITLANSVTPSTNVTLANTVPPSNDVTLSNTLPPFTLVTVTNAVTPTTHVTFLNAVTPSTNAVTLADAVTPPKDVTVTAVVTPSTDVTVNYGGMPSTDVAFMKAVKPSTDVIITNAVSPSTNVTLADAVTPSKDVTVTTVVMPSTDATKTNVVTPSTDVTVTAVVTRSTDVRKSNAVTPCTDVAVTKDVKASTDVTLANAVISCTNVTGMGTVVPSTVELMNVTQSLTVKGNAISCEAINLPVVLPTTVTSTSVFTPYTANAPPTVATQPSIVSPSVSDPSTSTTSFIDVAQSTSDASVTQSMLVTQSTNIMESGTQANATPADFRALSPFVDGLSDGNESSNNSIYDQSLNEFSDEGLSDRVYKPKNENACFMGATTQRYNKQDELSSEDIVDVETVENDVSKTFVVVSSVKGAPDYLMLGQVLFYPEKTSKGTVDVSIQSYDNDIQLYMKYANEVEGKVIKIISADDDEEGTGAVPYLSGLPKCCLQTPDHVKAVRSATERSRRMALGDLFRNLKKELFAEIDMELYFSKQAILSKAIATLNELSGSVKKSKDIKKELKQKNTQLRKHLNMLLFQKDLPEGKIVDIEKLTPLLKSGLGIDIVVPQKVYRSAEKLEREKTHPLAGDLLINNAQENSQSDTTRKGRPPQVGQFFRRFFRPKWSLEKQEDGCNDLSTQGPNDKPIIKDTFSIPTEAMVAIQCTEDRLPPSDVSIVKERASLTASLEAAAEIDDAYDGPIIQEVISLATDPQNDVTMEENKGSSQLDGEPMIIDTAPLARLGDTKVNALAEKLLEKLTEEKGEDSEKAETSGAKKTGEGSTQMPDDKENSTADIDTKHQKPAEPATEKPKNISVSPEALNNLRKITAKTISNSKILCNLSRWSVHHAKGDMREMASKDFVHVKITNDTMQRVDSEGKKEGGQLEAIPVSGSVNTKDSKRDKAEAGTQCQDTTQDTYLKKPASMTESVAKVMSTIVPGLPQDVKPSSTSQQNTASPTFVQQIKIQPGEQLLSLPGNNSTLYRLVKTQDLKNPGSNKFILQPVQTTLMHNVSQSSQPLQGTAQKAQVTIAQSQVIAPVVSSNVMTLKTTPTSMPQIVNVPKMVAMGSAGVQGSQQKIVLQTSPQNVSGLQQKIVLQTSPQNVSGIQKVLLCTNVQSVSGLQQKVVLPTSVQNVSGSQKKIVLQTSPQNVSGIQKVLLCTNVQSVSGLQQKYVLPTSVQNVSGSQQKILLQTNPQSVSGLPKVVLPTSVQNVPSLQQKVLLQTSTQNVPGTHSKAASTTYQLIVPSPAIAPVQSQLATTPGQVGNTNTLFRPASTMVPVQPAVSNETLHPAVTHPALTHAHVSTPGRSPKLRTPLNTPLAQYPTNVPRANEKRNVEMSITKQGKELAKLTPKTVASTTEQAIAAVITAQTPISSASETDAATSAPVTLSATPNTLPLKKVENQGMAPSSVYVCQEIVSKTQIGNSIPRVVTSYVSSSAAASSSDGPVTAIQKIIEGLKSGTVTPSVATLTANHDPVSWSGAVLSQSAIGETAKLVNTARPTVATISLNQNNLPQVTTILPGINLTPNQPSSQVMPKVVSNQAPNLQTSPIQYNPSLQTMVTARQTSKSVMNSLPGTRSEAACLNTRLNAVGAGNLGAQTSLVYSPSEVGSNVVTADTLSCSIENSIPDITSELAVSDGGNPQEPTLDSGQMVDESTARHFDLLASLDLPEI